MLYYGITCLTRLMKQHQIQCITTVYIILFFYSKSINQCVYGTFNLFGTCTM